MKGDFCLALGGANLDNTRNLLGNSSVFHISFPLKFSLNSEEFFRGPTWS